MFLAPRYRPSGMTLSPLGQVTRAPAMHPRKKLSTGGLRSLPALCDSAPHTPPRRPSWTGNE